MPFLYTQRDFTPIEQLQSEEDLKIASLDPLHADAILKKLPLMNSNADVKALADTCYDLLPRPSQLKSFSYYEAAAAMRDIGFFLGSIKKHGKEPVEVIPELDYVLDVLGNMTSLPPRDTLIHYTVWNPADLRCRTYTGTTDEQQLIKSVQIAMLPVIKAIYGLVRLHEMDPADQEFASQALTVADDFQQMIEGIIYARRNVSTEVFANTLRYYFDPIQLHGKTYLGPGAVEMPVFVYDHLLWSSRSEDLVYNQFKETYLPYVLPYLRETYDQFRRRPSLLEKVCDALEQDNNRQDALLNSAKAIMKLCIQLKSFRMPHKKMAEEAYSYGSKEHKKEGSGGYTTDILSVILQHNLSYINRLERAIAIHK